MNESESSTPRPLRLLIVDESGADAQRVQEALRAGGFGLSAETVYTKAGLLAAVARPSWDLVLVAQDLTELEAPQALALLRERDPDTAVIALCPTLDGEAVVELMKAGATTA